MDSISITGLLRAERNKLPMEPSAAQWRQYLLTAERILADLDNGDLQLCPAHGEDSPRLVDQE